MDDSRYPVRVDEKSEGTSTPSDNSVIEEEYPSAFKLAMIVVALMLSMFLASLDMVSSFMPARCLKIRT